MLLTTNEFNTCFCKNLHVYVTFVFKCSFSDLDLIFHQLAPAAFVAAHSGYLTLYKGYIYTHIYIHIYIYIYI